MGVWRQSPPTHTTHPLSTPQRQHWCPIDPQDVCGNFEFWIFQIRSLNNIHEKYTNTSLNITISDLFDSNSWYNFNYLSYYIRTIVLDIQIHSKIHIIRLLISIINPGEGGEHIKMQISSNANIRSEMRTYRLRITYLYTQNASNYSALCVITFALVKKHQRYRYKSKFGF